MSAFVDERVAEDASDYDGQGVWPTLFSFSFGQTRPTLIVGNGDDSVRSGQVANRALIN